MKTSMFKYLAVLAIALFLVGARAHATTNLQPSAGAPAPTTQFTWTNNDQLPSGEWPENYQTYIIQGSTPVATGPASIFTAASLGCASGGTCTLPAQSLVAGEEVAWQVTPLYNSEPGVYNWSPFATFYAADPAGATDPQTGSLFPLNTMDTADPCTKWTFVSDFPGQTRLVFFVNTSTGVGVGVFPKSTAVNQNGTVVLTRNWTTVDISDLVPLDARAAIVHVETVYSASCSNDQYCDLIGFQTRRTGSTNQTAGIWYTTSARHFADYTIPLNQGKFDFMWGTVPDNGINVAQTLGSNVTGEEVAGRLVGYCE
jgi:hypothetical protein